MKKKLVFITVFVLLCSAYVLYKYMGNEYIVRVLSPPKIMSGHKHSRENWELILGFVCLCSVSAGQCTINSSICSTKADYFM